MPSNVTHRFVSPILWKLIQPLYSSAIQHVFAAAVVYTHRSVPPIPALPTLPVGQRATASCSHLFPNSTASSAAIQKRLSEYEVIDNPPRSGKDYNDQLRLVKGISGRVRTRGGEAR